MGDWTSFCRWAIYVNVPSGLGRLASLNRLRAGQRAFHAIYYCTGLNEDQVDTDIIRHRDEAYDFRVYASGPKPPVPPGPLRTSVPDGG